MQREEIISGIKQAVERGYSLEKAKASFINAGYSPQDVEDSAKVFFGVSSSMPQFSSQKQVTSQALQVPIQQPKQKPMQQIILPSPQQINVNIIPSRQGGKAMLVFIILLAIVLILLLAFLFATLLFKEELTAFLEPIFPSWFSSASFLGLI
ncbi:MAG: hypothetical protein NT076_04540 [Candidatus Pacearchaeota archaeon]|nr:hypothetical protein [Candidatus Pacearchaeota archaeon]